MKSSLKFYFVAATFFLVLSPEGAFAMELYQPGLPARCLAMGGTCIAHIKGAQAMFFNAATLARVEGFDVTLVQANAAVSKNAESYVNAIQNNSGNKISSSDIQNLYGKTITADVSARAGLAISYFGVGAYSTNYLTESFSNPAYPTFNLNYVSDYGYLVAGAIPLAPMTSLGIAGRNAKRWGGSKDVDVTTLLNSSNQDIINETFPNRGAGVALDLSLITTLPDLPLKPTLALSWLDVGQTRYRVYSGNEDPPTQHDNLIFGSAIEHDFLFGHWTHSFEYQYITTSGEDLSKKLHFGTEVSYGPLDLRAGLSQGYLTYGAGVDLFFLQIDATAFTSEMGAYAGQTRNDRYQVGVTIGFEFDQGFKLTNLDGKKRRLKQRR